MLNQLNLNVQHQQHFFHEILIHMDFLVTTQNPGTLGYPKIVDFWISNNPKYGNFSSFDPSTYVNTTYITKFGALKILKSTI